MTSSYISLTYRRGNDNSTIELTEWELGQVVLALVQSGYQPARKVADTIARVELNHGLFAERSVGR